MFIPCINFTNCYYIPLQSTDTNEWQKGITEGQTPVGRAFHAACAVNDVIYVFGGYNAGGLTSNEIHMLDTGWFRRDFEFTDCSYNDLDINRIQQTYTISKVRTHACIRRYFSEFSAKFTHRLSSLSICWKQRWILCKRHSNLRYWFEFSLNCSYCCRKFFMGHYKGH